MSNYLSFLGVSKNAVIAAAALITLGTGIAFVIRAGNNNNATIQQWQTQDGRVVGSITGSGNLKVTGNLSGSTLFLGGMPAGQSLCKKTNGSIGQCTSIVGAGGACTCI